MHMHSRSLAPLALSLLLLTAGCGEPDSSTLCVAVSITVTYNGEPVEGAQVTFFANGEGARNCQGVTDESGRAVLGTFDFDDGAQPGPYKVTVKKVAEGDAGITAGASDPALAGIDVGDTAVGGGGLDPTLEQVNPDGTAIDPPKSPLPAKYETTEASGLTFNVDSSGSNDFTVDLKD
jgi:hypothetical protein